MLKPRYIVVSTSIGLTMLQDLVNERMDAGYTPLGGVAVSHKGSRTVYTQAMIIDRRSYPFEFAQEKKQ